MTEFHDGSGPPPRAESEARPARRLLHHLMALAGWTLFVYWWWVVFQRVSETEIRFTLVFIALALVLVVVLTVFWVVHNRAIWKRKGPRLKPIENPGFVKRDSLGRRVRFAEARPKLVESSLVRVDVEETEKVYYHGILEIL